MDARRANVIHRIPLDKTSVSFSYWIKHDFIAIIYLCISIYIPYPFKSQAWIQIIIEDILLYEKKSFFDLLHGRILIKPPVPDTLESNLVNFEFLLDLTGKYLTVFEITKLFLVNFPVKSNQNAKLTELD